MPLLKKQQGVSRLLNRRCNISMYINEERKS